MRALCRGGDARVCRARVCCRGGLGGGPRARGGGSGGGRAAGRALARSRAPLGVDPHRDAAPTVHSHLAALALALALVLPAALLLVPARVRSLDNATPASVALFFFSLRDDRACVCVRCVDAFALRNRARVCVLAQAGADAASRSARTAPEEGVARRLTSQVYFSRIFYDGRSRLIETECRRLSRVRMESVFFRTPQETCSRTFVKSRSSRNRGIWKRPVVPSVS